MHIYYYFITNPVKKKGKGCPLYLFLGLFRQNFKHNIPERIFIFDLSPSKLYRYFDILSQ